jgi:transcriptional regulator with XRE-family HTH domain
MMTVHQPTPPNFVRAWRKYRKLTQEQLGEAIGTSGSVVSLLERGERPLSDDWLAKLAEALGTTRGTLLDQPPGPQAEILSFMTHAGNRELRAVAKFAEGLMSYRADDDAG